MCMFAYEEINQLQEWKTKEGLLLFTAESLHHATNKGTRCQKAEQVLYVKILMLVNIDLFRFNIED